MTSYQLNAAEAELARAVEAGEICDLTNNRSSTVRPAILRRLVFGLSVVRQEAGSPEVVPMAPAGLRLIGATIAEHGHELDLNDASTDDGGLLPPLALEHCTIPRPIRMKSARLRRLSLRNSRIVHLDASGLVLDGDLDLSGLGSAEPEGAQTGCRSQGLCWVELQGARIEGSLLAADATLVAPPKRDATERGTASARHALDLQDGHIHDRMTLMPNFRAFGGVRLKEVGGDVRIAGGTLVAEEGDALTAQLAHIGGAMLLRSLPPTEEDTQPFVAEGDLWLYDATIVGDLDMRGARLTGNLVAQGAQLDGAVLLRTGDGQVADDPEALRFSVSGSVDFLGARIAGTLEMSEVDLAGDLIVQGAEIGGSALLCAKKKPGESSATFPVSVRGRIDFAHAKIHRSLMIEASFCADLQLDHAEIDDELLLDLSCPPPERSLPGTSAPKPPPPTICLRCARVGSLDDQSADGVTGFNLVTEGFQYDRLANFQLPVQGWRTRVVAVQNWLGGLAPEPWGTAVALACFVASLVLALLRQPLAAPVFILWILTLGLIIIREWPIAPDTARRRVKWLQQQYETWPPKRDQYRPEPFERLTRYFRSQGLFAEAQHVARARLNIERKLKTFVLLRPFLLLYGWTFDHGMSPSRALATFTFCLFVGWGGVWVADYGYEPASAPWWAPLGDRPIDPVLRIDALPVMPLASGDVADFVRSPLAGGAVSTGEELPCKAEIEPFIYALDVFVPALDLGQEGRCAVTTEPEGQVWRAAFTSYSILGWIVTSLTILTISGILRRQAEG